MANIDYNKLRRLVSPEDMLLFLSHSDEEQQAAYDQIMADEQGTKRLPDLGDAATSAIERAAKNKISGLFSGGGAAEMEAGLSELPTVPMTATPSSMMGPTMGASNVATAAPSGWAVNGIGSAGNYFLPAAGAVGAFDLFSNDRRGFRAVGQGAASGAAIGSYFGPPGAGIGAGIGAVVGGIQGFTRSGKSEAQVGRDETRKALQQMGVLDNNFGVELADGTKFDMGKDGHAELKSTDGSARRYWDTDSSSALTHQSVGWANPLAYIFGFGSGKDATQTQQLASYLTNAATSNASNLEGSRANFLAIAKKAGLDNDSAANVLTQLKQSGKISQQEYDSALYGVGTMFNGKYDPNEKAKSATPPSAMAMPSLDTALAKNTMNIVDGKQSSGNSSLIRDALKSGNIKTLEGNMNDLVLRFDAGSPEAKRMQEYSKGGMTEITGGISNKPKSKFSKGK